MKTETSTINTEDDNLDVTSIENNENLDETYETCLKDIKKSPKF